MIIEISAQLAYSSMTEIKLLQVAIVVDGGHNLWIQSQEVSLACDN